MSENPTFLNSLSVNSKLALKLHHSMLDTLHYMSELEQEFDKNIEDGIENYTELSGQKIRVDYSDDEHNQAQELSQELNKNYKILRDLYFKLYTAK